MKIKKPMYSICCKIFFSNEAKQFFFIALGIWVFLNVSSPKVVPDFRLWPMSITPFRLSRSICVEINIHKVHYNARKNHTHYTGRERTNIFIHDGVPTLDLQLYIFCITTYIIPIYMYST